MYSWPGWAKALTCAHQKTGETLVVLGLRTRNRLSWVSVWGSSGEYRNGKCPSRIGTGNAHEREMADVYAAGFPSICSSGDGGRNARHGANAFGGRAGRQRNAQRRIDSGLFTGMDSSLLSLVRAARIGGWPDHQFVPLGGAGGRGSGLFAGFAS